MNMSFGAGEINGIEQKVIDVTACADANQKFISGHKVITLTVTNLEGCALVHPDQIGLTGKGTVPIDIGTMRATVKVDTTDLDRTLALLSSIEARLTKLKPQFIEAMFWTFALGLALGFLIGQSLHG